MIKKVDKGRRCPQSQELKKMLVLTGCIAVDMGTGKIDVDHVPHKNPRMTINFHIRNGYRILPRDGVPPGKFPFLTVNRFDPRIMEINHSGQIALQTPGGQVALPVYLRLAGIEFEPDGVIIMASRRESIKIGYHHLLDIMRTIRLTDAKSLPEILASDLKSELRRRRTVLLPGGLLGCI